MEQINIKKLIGKTYNLIEILSKNEFKEVSLVENIDNKERIIIKEINLSKLNEKEKEMLSQEGNKLSTLKHPNIIECYEFHYEKDKIIISIKYEKRGDLLIKIENQKKIF